MTLCVIQDQNRHPLHALCGSDLMRFEALHVTLRAALSDLDLSFTELLDLLERVVLAVELDQSTGPLTTGLQSMGACYDVLVQIHDVLGSPQLAALEQFDRALSAALVRLAELFNHESGANAAGLLEIIRQGLTPALSYWPRVESGLSAAIDDYVCRQQRMIEAAQSVQQFDN